MIKVFCSYTHKDEELRDQVHSHCGLLIRQGFIDIWHDRKILAGQDFAQSIDSAIEAADLILLMVSADFISSEYCYGIEMKKALERHDAGLCHAMPVILRDCDWHEAPFGKLMAAPKDGRAVTLWADRDAALKDVAVRVREVAKNLQVKKNPTAPIHDVAAEFSHQNPTVTAFPQGGGSGEKIICVHCGRAAGEGGRCLTASGMHEFRGYPGNEIISCAQCGHSAGQGGRCIAASGLHRFRGYPTERKIVCVYCGHAAGSGGRCTSAAGLHDFRFF